MRISIVWILLIAVPALAADPPTAPVTTTLTLAEKASPLAIAWLPNREEIACLRSNGVVEIWDNTQQKQRATMSFVENPGFVSVGLLAVSPDGRSIAVSMPGAFLKIWHLATNRVTEIPASKAPQGFAAVRKIEFTPDSQAVLLLSAEHHLATITLTGDLQGAITQMPMQFGKGERALIRDSAVVALNPGLGLAYYEGFETDELRVWDYRKNELRHQMTLKENILARPITIAPNGRIVALTPTNANTCVLELYENPSLTPLFSIKARDFINLERLHRFSPDSRYFSLEQPRLPTTITIYDLALGQAFAQLMIPNEESTTPPATGQGERRPQVRAIVYSPGGRYVATATHDSRIQIHDLRGAVDPTPLTSLNIPSEWNDLVSPDSPTAMRAVFRLADHPNETMKFVREKLQPVVKPTADEIHQWITALEAPAFADRRTALKKLSTVGDAIEPELRQEIARNTSPETVQTLTTILDTVAKSQRKPQGEALRTYRVVQLLEMIGPPARKLLAEYAAGATKAFLTTEAAEALSRMKHERK